MKKGDLFQSVERGLSTGFEKTIVEVLRTYDKRDIDPHCPQSIAIVGMVEAVVLSGSDIGRKQRWKRQSFRRMFVKIEEAS